MTNNTFDNTTRFNWGFFEAQADKEHNRPDRQCIPQGEFFCLPKWDKPYRDGYAAGRRD